MRHFFTVLFFSLLIATTLAEGAKSPPPSFQFEFPAIAGLDDFLKDYGADYRREVEKDHAEQVAEGLDSPTPWSLDLSAAETFNNNRLQVVFVTGYDYRGGAHGIPVLDVFYFDAQSKKQLSQAEVLLDDALESIASVARRDLVAQGFEKNDEWMLKGTEPSQENYRLVVPAEDGLQVKFASYQVAPYAAGVPEVTIPWGQAKAFLRPAYRS